MAFEITVTTNIPNGILAGSCECPEGALCLQDQCVMTAAPDSPETEACKTAGEGNVYVLDGPMAGCRFHAASIGSIIEGEPSPGPVDLGPALIMTGFGPDAGLDCPYLPAHVRYTFSSVAYGFDTCESRLQAGGPGVLEDMILVLMSD